MWASNHRKRILSRIFIWAWCQGWDAVCIHAGGVIQRKWRRAPLVKRLSRRKLVAEPRLAIVNSPLLLFLSIHCRELFKKLVIL